MKIEIHNTVPAFDRAERSKALKSLAAELTTEGVVCKVVKPKYDPYDKRADDEEYREMLAIFGRGIYTEKELVRKVLGIGAHCVFRRQCYRMFEIKRENAVCVIT